MTRYTVIGAGAVGLLYGGRLQQAGHAVTWVVPSAAEKVRTAGIRIDAGGTTTALDAEVVSTPADAPAADVVLVALKTTANDRLAELVGPAVADGATVSMFQNGLGVEDELRRAVPAAGAVLGALCFVCAHRRSPGHVEHLDYGPVDLAEHGASTITPAVVRLAADLDAAGFAVAAHDDLTTARWRKLVWNIPYNGLSVVLDAGTAELMAHASATSLVTRVMSEVVVAGRACGADLDERFAEGRREMTRTMTPYAPSMKLDFDAGRQLEIGAIYDAPLEAARAAGASMPTVEALRDQLRFLDSPSGP